MIRSKDTQLSILLLLYGFFCAFTASGTLPLISKASDVISTSFAFVPYFIGSLTGQLLILWSKRLRKSKWPLILSPLIFVLTVWWIRDQLFDPNQAGFAISIILIRGLEGLAIGIGLPLIFENFVQKGIGKTLETRLILINSITPLGFIVGVPVAETWSSPMGLDFLKFCGMVLIGITLLLVSIILSQKSSKTETFGKEKLKFENWFDTFFLTFLAKCFYGFLLSHLIFRSEIFPFDFFWITLMIGFLYISGQILGSFLIEKVQLNVLEIYVPLLITWGVSLLAFEASFLWFAIAALGQGMVFLFGLRRIAKKPDTAGEFAFINSLSDPGSVVGSALPLLGVPISYFVLAGLGLIPFVKFLFKPIQKNRAESLHPFVDPITLIKVFLKQKYPLISSNAELEKIQSDVPRDFNWESINKDKGQVSILFGGDVKFLEGLPSFNKVDQQWIQSKDVRILNLEAPFSTPAEGPLRSQFLHSSLQVFKDWNFQSQGPLFNGFSVINNHCLDRGKNSFLQTQKDLKELHLHVINESFGIIEVMIDGAPLKIGTLGKAFGCNLPWKHHELPDAWLNPDFLLQSRKIQRRLETEIKSAKAQCDLLVMSYHWGYEAEVIPSETQRRAWEWLSDQGVDILYGHHSHFPQPHVLDRDRNKVCLFSMGNFHLPMIQRSYNATMLSTIDIKRTNGSWKIVSVESRFFQNLHPKSARFQEIPVPSSSVLTSEFINENILKELS